MNRRIKITVAVAVLGLCLLPVAQAADLSQMAQTLSELRREVEGLSNGLSLEKEDLRAGLRALDQQKSELQVQLRQQELRAEQLEQALEAQRSARSEIIAAGQTLTPAVAQSIQTLRGAVAQSLPFRLEERLEELDMLQAELESQRLTPRETAQRLWSFSEDELRLSSENALDRQVITLEGEEVLVDVARIGMVAIYYRDDSAQVGRAVRTEAGWSWVLYTDPLARQQVLELFSALEKQIRVGFFELPTALISAPLPLDPLEVR